MPLLDPSWEPRLEHEAASMMLGLTIGAARTDDQSDDEKSHNLTVGARAVSTFIEGLMYDQPSTARAKERDERISEIVLDYAARMPEEIVAQLLGD